MEHRQPVLTVLWPASQGCSIAGNIPLKKMDLPHRSPGRDYSRTTPAACDAGTERMKRKLRDRRGSLVKKSEISRIGRAGLRAGQWSGAGRSLAEHSLLPVDEQLEVKCDCRCKPAAAPAIHRRPGRTRLVRLPRCSSATAVPVCWAAVHAGLLVMDQRKARWRGVEGTQQHKEAGGDGSLHA